MDKRHATDTLDRALHPWGNWNRQTSATLAAQLYRVGLPRTVCNYESLGTTTWTCVVGDCTSVCVCVVYVCVRVPNRQYRGVAACRGVPRLRQGSARVESSSFTSRSSQFLWPVTVAIQIVTQPRRGVLFVFKMFIIVYL